MTAILLSVEPRAEDAEKTAAPMLVTKTAAATRTRKPARLKLTHTSLAHLPVGTEGCTGRAARAPSHS